MKVLRAIDLCAGCGGWACATRGLPIRVVAAFDLWPTACKTYEINHPETRVICGDLRDPAIQQQVLDLRDIDIVLGGIPCEWLSSLRRISKKIQVMPPEVKAQQETLDAVLDLVKRIDPRWWCLEDVKDLVKHLPILTPWLEINSRNYSAQRRKRIYVGDFPRPGEGDCQDLMKDKLRPGPYRIGARAFGRTPQLARQFTNTTTLAAYPNRKSPTVTAINSRRDAELVIVDDRIPGGTRQLEWQEAAVLQGFPDDYLFYGSPTDVSAMIGRAVQIDTARAILQAMAIAAESARRKQHANL